MNEILNVNGVECYEKDGTAYLKLETVNNLLEHIGFPNKLGKACFIPKNIFYPTQYAMERGWFEIKETCVTHAGHTTISRTPKVTGKGQIYFVEKFLRESATASS